MKNFPAVIIFFLFAFSAMPAIPTMPAATAAATTQQKMTQTTTIMVFGDSLSANYGIPIEAGWVNLLTQRLQSLSPFFQVINTSISGETTFSGRNRIEQALKTHRPDIVILGLGANDGLRGSAISTIYQNLEAIIKICQQNNASILLAGMQLPPNYGMTYTQKFKNIYPQLSENYQTGLIPFLLEGFGENHEFFQSDGIHPTVSAQEKIVENVWNALYPMIQDDIAAINSENEYQTH